MSASLERSTYTRELFHLVRSTDSEDERQRLMDTVIEMHLDLAHAEAARYRSRGVPLDDLRQVAALALTKATRGYDVTTGHDFLSYAVPTIRGELRRHFRPEFLNRIDEIIVFHGLKPEHLRQIVAIQLEDLRKSLADRHIRLTLTDEASRHLVDTGYDPVYGARPLKRAIQKQVTTKLGRLIIEGKVHDGDEVVVDYDARTKDLRFAPVAVPA